MCRLLGYVTRSPRALEEAVGAATLKQFTALSSLHSDGWGTAWCSRGELHRVSAPGRADSDFRYAELTSQAVGTAGLVHLRWATDGLAVSEDNTHPFADDSMAVAHNGYISPVGEVEALLAPEARAQLRGSTDSERYFRLITQYRSAPASNDVEAVRRAVAQLLRRFPAASLNALILTRQHFMAVHASSAATAPLEDLAKRFAGRLHQVPRDHVDAYFQMRYRVEPSAVLVASSGIGGAHWTDLAQNTLLIIDTASLAARQERLLPA